MTEVRCAAGSPVELIARLGGGDDQLTVTADLTARLYGGPGDDVLQGGPGLDTVTGGPGDDTLSGGGHPSGSDLRDVVRFEDGHAPVTVDLRRGTAERADGIDHLRGFDEVVGGGGPDIMRAADSGGIVLDGAAGADRLIGGPGPDTLIGRGGMNQIAGGGGDDHLTGSGRLAGGPGRDDLHGRTTADDLNGGSGADVVVTGGGGDQVRAIDASIDEIDCRGPAGSLPGMRVAVDAGERGPDGLRRQRPVGHHLSPAPSRLPRDA